MALTRVVALATLLLLANASPAPTAPARLNAVQQVPLPDITHYPTVSIPTPTKTIQKRVDILSKLATEVSSVLSALGTGVPAYVASGTYSKGDLLFLVEYAWINGCNWYKYFRSWDASHDRRCLLH
jgi:hypothetical protein